jgi:4-phospho-D-threonate 3-dehydrogenase / 4-phospho-D-erythronate 3-dehydrogenase
VSDLPIGITMGDPAGVGPEITLKGLRDLFARRGEIPVIVYGSLAALRVAAERYSIPAVIDGEGTAARWPRVSVSLVPEPTSPPTMGEVQAEAGEVAYAAIAEAVKDAMASKICAIVTAPISKEALNLSGHVYSGQTEMLADLSDTAGTCMMLAHGDLRVSHVSTHTALANVPALLTDTRLSRVIELTYDALSRLGIAKPRIAVAGLNPHAGESGLFGKEDGEVIAPVVARYHATGMSIRGPIPGDTVFVRALAREFDAVIAIYHDQGHIPVKLLGFRVDPGTGRWIGLSGVNVTLGLPFVRTSVDHGTAFDIAGKGIASAQSMIEAIEFALNLVSRPSADPKLLTRAAR